MANNRAQTLQQTGVLNSSRTAPTAYVEQGVVLDGSQKLDFGTVFGVDTAQSIFGISMIATDPGNFMVPIAWSPGAVAEGKLYVVFPSAGNVLVGPDIRTNTGLVSPPGITGAAGRIHVLFSTSFDGSVVTSSLALWDATNGWQTTSTNGPAGSTAVQYTSNNGPLTLLKQQDNSNQTSGTVYRIFGFHGVSCDPAAASDRNKFFNGAVTEDPAVSLAAFGDPVFDCRGDAATWNSGTFPFGSFTKTGNAFLDA